MELVGGTHGSRSSHAFAALRRAQRSIERAERESIRETGLTLAQFDVLAGLYVHGEQRICTLTSMLLSTPGNMTVVLRNLERDGLLVRRRDDRDARVFVVGLTERGRELAERVIPEHAASIDELFSVLSPEEEDSLIRILGKLKDVDVEYDAARDHGGSGSTEEGPGCQLPAEDAFP